MQLSEHFSFEELTRTEVRQLAGQNVEAARIYLDPLRRTAALLENVREILGVPLVVDSGFRCKELNDAIGGSPSSQHCFGQAADFRAAGWVETDFKLAVAKLMDAKLRFHQLLIENGCLHIGTPYDFDIEGEVAEWKHELVDGVWQRTKSVIRERVTA